jgi:hypothetical protein
MMSNLFSRQAHSHPGSAPTPAGNSWPGIFPDVIDTAFRREGHTLARLLLKHKGIRKPFLYIPVPVCRAMAFLMEKNMKRLPLTRYAISRILHEAAFDHAPATRDLGYDPAGVREGLRRIAPPS